MVTRFPGKGKGMKVFRKTWPENTYWQVMHVEMTSEKTAKFFGIKYENGKLCSTKVDKIPGVAKRGIWQFDINGAFSLSEEEAK